VSRVCKVYVFNKCVECARVSLSEPEGAGVCSNINKCARVRDALLKCAYVCSSVQLLCHVYHMCQVGLSVLE
jgi:hypothetical protein